MNKLNKGKEGVTIYRIMRYSAGKICPAETSVEKAETESAP